MSEPTTIAVIPAVPVDAQIAPWAITDEDVFGTNTAVLRHDFSARVDDDGITWNRRVEYLLPRRAQPVDFDANQATINVDAAAVARWSTFEDHVKADVVFTGKPSTLQLWFAVNWVGVTPLEDDNNVTLVDPITGELVGLLRAPFLRDNTGIVHNLAWLLGDGCLTVDLPDLDDDLWVGAVFDPTTVDTSTSALATGYSNQKKAATLSTGTLVFVFNNGTPEAEFWYSTDNGATWTQYTSGTSNIGGYVNGSISDPWVDSGGVERVVVVWKQSGVSGTGPSGGARTTDVIYAAVGTFNAGRTTLTWGAALDWTSATFTVASATYPDVTAVASGTGGLAYAVLGYGAGSNTRCYGRSITVSSLGVMTANTVTQIGGDSTAATVTNAFPSVCVDSSNRLHVSWSGGKTGAGAGIKYSTNSNFAGSWVGASWSAEVAVSTAYYWSDADNEGMVCRWDGTRAVILGYLFDGTNRKIEIWDSTSFTAFTNRVDSLLNFSSTAGLLGFGATIDTVTGNAYLFGSNFSGSYNNVNYYKVTRSGTALSLGARVVADTFTGGGNSPHVFAWYSGSTVRWVYTRGSVSPYSLSYDKLTLNQAPSAATWNTASGAKDINASLALSWNFVDPDAGDTQSAYALKRDIGGTVRWWNGSTFGATVETYVTSSTSALTLASGWGADSDADHNYYVLTKDAAGTPGTGYSAALVITPSAKVAPTLDHPSAAEVVGNSSFDAQWTVAQQTTYQVKLYDATGVTTLWDSGVITESVGRRRTIAYVLANTTSYKLGLTTKNNEGLASDEVIHSFSVSYTAPHAATFTLTPVDEPGYVRIAITNPTPTGSQPAVAYSLVRRRAVGDTGTGGVLIDSAGDDIHVANNGTYDDHYLGHNEDVEYQVVVVGANGTTYTTAWQSS